MKPVTLEESYRYCREVARKRAKNFYYSFLLLDSQQRSSMCAIYTFMRQCDDLSDDPSAADANAVAGKIDEWRLSTEHALNAQFDGHPLWPAFYDTVRRYNIPHRFFHEMIEGVRSDLDPREIQSFEELYRYCYHVASVVGLTIIHIFGFESQKALLLAEKSGVAFQLTNILRDVREDAAMGRIYLPNEDLTRFGVAGDQLRSGIEDVHFRELMRFEAARARDLYRESAPLESLISEKSRASLWAIREIYMNLLDVLERENFNVLSKRLNVPTYTKIAILFRAFLRQR